MDIKFECVGSNVKITVRDTGKGMTPDFLPHVFDSFRQDSSATARQFGGLGLDLAIVRQSVELHDGTVQAFSPPEGLGATFTVMLPVINVEPQTIEETQMPDNLPNLKGLRILLVDDDVDTLDFLDFLLQDYGALVRTTASAHEALEVFSQWKPQVLVSDIGMPEFDGYMLMRRIRTMPLWQAGQLQAIALTAYAGDTNHQQILEAGFHRHVTKPVDPDEFMAIIAGVVKESKIPLL